jgi:hypothetical protein
MDDEGFGDRLLDELEGKQASDLQIIPGGDESASPGILDYVEEYAMFFILFILIFFFSSKYIKSWMEKRRYESTVQSAEESMRRARMLQQARFEVETAQRREELQRLEEERRKQKLEEMEAMMEGRSAKKPETKKGPDTREFWDRADGFNPLQGGGGGSGGRYQPTCRRRGG